MSWATLAGVFIVAITVAILALFIYALVELARYLQRWLLLIEVA